jgi:hypothetical protein
MAGARSRLRMFFRELCRSLCFSFPNSIFALIVGLFAPFIVPCFTLSSDLKSACILHDIVRATESRSDFVGAALIREPMRLVQNARR